ncbi:MAG: hypothetical protein ACHP9W_07025 [Steroidobacterales bacterium]
MIGTTPDSAAIEHNVAKWRRVNFNALIRYSFVIEEGIHFSAVVAMRNIAAKIEQPEFFCRFGLEKLGLSWMDTGCGMRTFHACRE